METAKQFRNVKVLDAVFINPEIFRLDFAWDGSAPKAGQFFMIKPKHSPVFLGRPISVSGWAAVSGVVSFLIARRGRGTAALADLRPAQDVELTGPLGNAWSSFLPAGKSKIALVSGGIGIAPLKAFAEEIAGGENPAFKAVTFDFYAGFKTGFKSDEERSGILGALSSQAEKFIIATEDGNEGLQGRIPDFLETGYAVGTAAVYVCGPEPMLKVTAAHCKEAAIPCFVSLERRMACGAGACLGCSVQTRPASSAGIINRRCCADGPIFPAEELVFDE